MCIYELPPDFVVFGDDLARSDGFAGEVATDLVVVVVNVVVDDDAVVIWRRLGRKSSPSLREITDEEDEELMCWEDLENKELLRFRKFTFAISVIALKMLFNNTVHCNSFSVHGGMGGLRAHLDIPT